MEKLINSIAETLKDYRSEEGDPNLLVTPKRVATWIEQFDPEDRLVILTELDHIFRKRYCSREGIKGAMEKVIKALAENYEQSNEIFFLANAFFIRTQEPNKSQNIMLCLLDEVLQECYGTTIEKCGNISHKYSIYVDDLLCTGNTLETELVGWSKQPFSESKTNKEAVEDKTTTLILAYIYVHKKKLLQKKSINGLERI